MARACQMLPPGGRSGDHHRLEPHVSQTMSPLSKRAASLAGTSPSLGHVGREGSGEQTDLTALNSAPRVIRAGTQRGPWSRCCTGGRARGSADAADHPRRRRAGATRVGAAAVGSPWRGGDALLPVLVPLSSSGNPEPVLWNPLWVPPYPQGLTQFFWKELASPQADL